MSDSGSNAQQYYDKKLATFYRAQEELYEAAKRLDKEGISIPPPIPIRYKLPGDRLGKTKRCIIGGDENSRIYVQTGEYTNKQLGEIFITSNKVGSLISGLLDSVAIIWSIAIQYGVPIEPIVEKLKSTRYEPSGMTGDHEFPTVTSIGDYIVRWIESKYCRRE